MTEAKCTTEGCTGTYRPYPGRQTTMCKPCVTRRNARSPERVAKLAATMREKHADPEWKKARAAGAKVAARKRLENPEHAAWMREHCRRMGTTHGGSVAGSPGRKAMGRKATERYLGHIPPEYRDEYRRLTGKTHDGREERSRLVLEMVEADRRRYERTGELQQAKRKK